MPRPKNIVLMDSPDALEKKFSLPEGEIHLWLLNKNDLPATVEEYYNLLSEEDRGRVFHYHNEQDREKFIFRHGVLISLLKHYLHSQEVELNLTAMHKPYMNTGDLTFNVSFSQDYLLFGFARGVQIGVDIEVAQPLLLADRLTKNCLSKEEYAAVQEKGEQQFLRFWNCKEALLKAMGTGLLYEPRDINCIDAGRSSSWVEFTAPFLQTPLWVSSHARNEVTFAVAVSN